MFRRIVVTNSRNWGVSEVTLYTHKRYDFKLSMVTPWKYGEFSFETTEDALNKAVAKNKYKLDVSSFSDFEVQLLEHSGRPEFIFSADMEEQKRLSFELHIEKQWWKNGFSYLSNQGWIEYSKSYVIYDGFEKANLRFPESYASHERLLCA